MAENSEIGWTDHTHNHWIGCTKISAGCRFCYAEVQVARWEPADPTRRQASVWGAKAQRRLTTLDNRRKPLRWNRRAYQTGARPRVFCASLADVFEQHWMLEPWRQDLFRLIEATPYLRWILLTKRIDLVAEMTRAAWGTDWPANVCLGTSIENQATVWRLGTLLNLAGPKERLASAEPLLEPVVVGETLNSGKYPLSLLIAGGESGRKARYNQLDVALAGLRDEAAAAQVPFYLKQWGEYAPFGQLPAETAARKQAARRRPYAPEDVVRVGKKHSGRALNGVEYDGVVASWAEEIAHLGVVHA